MLIFLAYSSFDVIGVNVELERESLILRNEMAQDTRRRASACCFWYYS